MERVVHSAWYYWALLLREEVKCQRNASVSRLHRNEGKRPYSARYIRLYEPANRVGHGATNQPAEVTHLPILKPLNSQERLDAWTVATQLPETDNFIILEYPTSPCITSFLGGPICKFIRKIFSPDSHIPKTAVWTQCCKVYIWKIN
jgi:hypothetical protein